MMTILGSLYLVPAIHAAAKLELAERLQDGPRTIADLAQETGCLPLALRRLLRSLAGAGIFTLDEDDLVGLTPLAATLASGTPGSVADMARAVGEPFYWSPWASLHAALRSGRSAFLETHGRTFFEYLAEHPEVSEPFDAWMSQSSRLQVPALLAAYDFGSARRVVDVGGGRGDLLTAILRRHPGLRGTLFDRPAVIAKADIPASVADRCEVLGGDFFDAVPPGADVYLLKQVLHDWDDERAVRILANCRRALGGGGRILALEMVMPESGGPHVSKAMDVAMMVFQDGGRERTEEEFRRLLAEAGLELRRVVPTSIPTFVLEAVPAE